MSPLDKLLEEVKIERHRQIDLPGSEYDLVNNVNDKNLLFYIFCQ